MDLPINRNLKQFFVKSKTPIKALRLAIKIKGDKPCKVDQNNELRTDFTIAVYRFCDFQ